MSEDGKTTFYDSLVRKFKNNRLVAIAVLVVMIVSGGVGTMGGLLGGYEKIKQTFSSQIILVSNVEVAAIGRLGTKRQRMSASSQFYLGLAVSVPPPSFR